MATSGHVWMRNEGVVRCVKCGEQPGTGVTACPAPAPALVVPLHDRAPLTDVPARLEQLAKTIRAGELEAAVALVVLASDQDDVTVHGYGRIHSDAHSVGLLHKAELEVLLPSLLPRPPGAERA